MVDRSNQCISPSPCIRSSSGTRRRHHPGGFTPKQAFGPCGVRDNQAFGVDLIDYRKSPTEFDVLEPSQLVLIVVGAHLRAEIVDRLTAYELQRSIISWMNLRFGPETADDPHPVHAVVCSDLWYLNNDSLRRRPTVSIGGPTVNAFSAYVADKLPSAYAVEGKLLVQLDVEGHDQVACCWGIDAARTTQAVKVFTERYLDAFLDAACATRR